MTKDWVHGVGHSPVCQILLQIVLRAVIISSPPAWTSSAGMLLTPADFPFLNDCTTGSTSLRRMGWSSSVVAFPCFTVVKSFTCWYVLLLLFFLRFSSVSLHCAPIQFSFAFFMHLLMSLFTSLYFAAPSGSNLFFLSSLLLSHRSRISAVIQGFFF